MYRGIILENYPPLCHELSKSREKSVPNAGLESTTPGTLDSTH